MNRKALAVLIAAMMVLTVFPFLGDDGGSRADGNIRSADVPPVSLRDNGNGSYTLESKYLENVFGIKGSAPSSVDDPVGTNAVGVTPLEFVSWRGSAGSSGSGYDVRTYDSNTVIRSEDETFVVDSNHGIGFSAALTMSNKGQYTPDAGMKGWDQQGFEKQDWFCDLFYDNNTGELILNVTNGPNNSRVSVDSAAGTGAFPLTEINHVTSIQSRNILNYAVGDFDADGNEEIAVHHWYGVYVFGLDQTTLKLELEHTFQVPRYNGYENSLFTPVSMCAGDVDRDGNDELLVTRAYYKNGVPGDTEFTDLGILDPERNTSKWVRVGVPDPKNPSSTLDSVMTSVAVGDIDNDGRPEIVIGGFLWDNKNTSKSYTEDWSKSAGELYLSYLEPDELLSGKVQFRGVTVLGDDNGTASTRYQDSFKDKYKLNSHDKADTSIYLTDDSDNPSLLCRSVNWCNWTVPMATGSLGGHENGQTKDEVFFDKWFYHFNGNGFAVYKTTSQLGKVMDNNNVICNSIEVGSITNRSPDTFDGKDEFIVYYAADLEKHYDNGDTEWVFVVYGPSDGSQAKSTYSVDLPLNYRDMRGWGLYNVGKTYTGNFNSDTYYVELQSRVFMYTEPTVIAVLAPVPYDQDLADVLFGGATAIGSTDYTEYTSHETQDESSVSFEIGPSGGIDTFVKTDINVRYTHDESWSNSKSITLSKTYSSPHDSVALYVIPTDVYFYKVYTPQSHGSYVTDYQMVPFYRDPVDTILEYDQYSEFINNYNRIMTDFNKDFAPIPVISLSDNVEGDITSYTTGPTAPLTSVPVYYRGSSDSGSVTKCVDLSSSTGRTWANGGMIDATIQASFIFASIGGGFSLSAQSAETVTDVSGMSFSSTLSNGMEVNYLGERSEARHVLSQYTMSGSLWAELRSVTIGGVQQEYVYVGYTVDDHTSAPKMGNLVPDVYIPGGDDDGDPYNPTDDSVCIKVTVPGTSDRSERAADRYVVQFQWQGFWYDVNGTNLGFTMYVEDGTGSQLTDGTLYPQFEDREVWVKIVGLSSVSNTDFKFRVDAVSERSGSVYHNPCLPVTAYKDTRVVGIQCTTVVGSPMTHPDYALYQVDGVESILISEGSIHDLDGHILAVVHTDLEPGERVNLWYYDHDSGFTMLAENLQVCFDGYVIYKLEDRSPVGGQDIGNAVQIGAFVFLLMALALFVTLSYRKD